MNNQFDELTKRMVQSVKRRAALRKFGAGLVITCFFALSSLAQPSGAGSALSFDGTGGSVSIATTGSLTGTFTVEAWASPNDSSLSGALALFGSRRPTDFSFDLIFWQGNLLHADIGNGYWYWITTSANAPFPYSVGTWYHIACVVTPTNYTIYVDGSPVASAAYPADSPLLYDDNHHLVIGNYAAPMPGLQEEYMNGQIDEVRIWNTARTALQIQTNAFRFLTGSEPGLMGYWRFDEGTDITVSDASGHGFVGTLVGNGVAWANSTFPDNKLLILTQPQDQTVQAGVNVTFSAEVFGAAPLSYQWLFNSNSLPGATNSSLTVADATPIQSGNYAVLIRSGSTNSMMSRIAALAVTAPQLRIARSGNGAVLWWPNSASGYVLETSSGLRPDRPWSVIPGVTIVIGDQNVVAVAPLAGPAFFRLRKP